MSAAGKSDSGTTLVETLVVMAILALVGSLSVVQFRQTMTAYTWRTAEAVVKSDLQIARSDALRGDRPVSFQVSADGSQYVWDGARPRALPAGVRLSGQSILFYGDGSSSGGELHIISARGEQRIGIESATGHLVSGAR